MNGVNTGSVTTRTGRMGLSGPAHGLQVAIEVMRVKGSNQVHGAMAPIVGGCMERPLGGASEGIGTEMIINRMEGKW